MQTKFRQANRRLTSPGLAPILPAGSDPSIAAPGAKVLPVVMPGADAVWPLTDGSGSGCRNIVNSTDPIRNLCYAPEQLFSAEWTSGGAAWTDAAGIAPNGKLTASRLQIAAAGGAKGGLAKISVVTGTTLTFSCWVKSNTGVAQKFRWNRNDTSSFSSDLIVTTDWARVSWTITTSGTLSNFLWATDLAGDAVDLLAWGFQIEAGTKLTDYQSAGLQGIFPPKSTLAPTWTARGISSSDVNRSAYALRPANITVGLETYYAAFKCTSGSSNKGWLLAENVGSSGYAKSSINVSNSAGLGTFQQNNQHLWNPVEALYDGVWHVIAAVTNQLTQWYYIDGALVAVYDNPASYTSQGFSLFNFGTNNPAIGMIGEIGYLAHYTTWHNASQVAAMTAYLQGQILARGSTLPSYAALYCYEGDSIMSGLGLAGVTNPVWAQIHPNLPANSFDAVFARTGSGLLSTGVEIGGLARVPYVDQMLSVPHTKAIFCEDFGRNDLNSSTAAQHFANVKAYSLARRAQGWKIVLCTILPSTATGFNVRRNAFNALVYGDNSFYDVLSDWAADPTMGPDSVCPDGGPFNATYYIDGTHPTQAGFDILAPILQTAVLSL